MIKNIQIMEVGLRDGLQVVQKEVSMELKLSIIDSLISSGVKNIQVASFVNPDRIPQMAQADELVKRLPIKKDIQFSALIFNQKGVYRAISSGLKKIETSISLCEKYSRKNMRMSVSESISNLKDIVLTSKKNEMNLRAGIQCVWNTNYKGSLDQDNILRTLSEIMEMDVLRVSLCDTYGMARPYDVSSLLEKIYETFPEIKISMHLHNTNGLGLINLSEALKFDIREIDTSMGGIGGSPFIQKSTGNIATEDTIALLNKIGYSLEIDIKKISKISRRLEKIIGSSYFSGSLYKTS